MVRKRVLLPLLFAAIVLVAVVFAYVVVPLAFLVPCSAPELQPDDVGLGLGSSSPAPSPGPTAAGSDGSCEEADACVCLRVSYAAMLAISCVVGAITGIACSQCYHWLVDGDEEEAAKKAGYVAFAGDLEAAPTGGKN